jgi:hypothetical protein
MLAQFSEENFVFDDIGGYPNVLHQNFTKAMNIIVANFQLNISNKFLEMTRV